MTDTCPLCGKPTMPEHKPFCSRGCKDRDLLKWLGEGYAIPGAPVDPEAPRPTLDTPETRD
ncbi:MAG: DNA gyrase inhibitor YacG [Sphingomonas sp.]|uniref:DNA gyrase inhibitor YacG n=1 Tax=Sphingomonas sp. TaxID=28214 RepID=UPI001204FD42|nr:DNA gyrase inhibitor YacG [Sphingomonas sp.]THD37311.1 MAG: DNA gyrase inhibitor YacG [Sphingomonas sp.]